MRYTGHMKTCGKCKIKQSVDNFFKNKARYDGLSGYCKKCHIAESKPRQDALRQDVINFLGAKCAECDWADPRSLHVDHINGGGNQERQAIAPTIIYKKVLAGEPGYQLLCANHNYNKRAENNEHYHIGDTKKEIDQWVEDESWKQNAITFNQTKKGIFTKGDKWSIKYDACIAHGDTDRPHKSGGLCATCYMQWKREKSDIGPASSNRTGGISAQ